MLAGLMKQAQAGMGSGVKGMAHVLGSGQSMGAALTGVALAQLPPGISLLKNLA